MLVQARPRVAPADPPRRSRRSPDPAREPIELPPTTTVRDLLAAIGFGAFLRVGLVLTLGIVLERLAPH